jgi:hypothetical protein
MAGVKRTTRKAAAKKVVARKRATATRATARKTARKAARPLRTASGTRLTRAYEQQLATEAEAGFDPAQLTSRRVGRPSLTGRPGKSRRLDLRVDDATFAAVHGLAHRQQRPVSDVVREALRRYVDAS